MYFGKIRGNDFATIKKLNHNFKRNYGNFNKQYDFLIVFQERNVFSSKFSTKKCDEIFQQKTVFEEMILQG